MRGYREETESPFSRKSKGSRDVKEWERCEVGWGNARDSEGLTRTTLPLLNAHCLDTGQAGDSRCVQDPGEVSWGWKAASE